MARWIDANRPCLLVSLLMVAMETGIALGTEPVLNTTAPVVTLYENTKVQTTLTGVPCTDADKDTTIVTFKSVTPTTTCSKCFTVLPCASPNKWCLVFLPNQGTLDYSKVPTYFITVECEANGDLVNETVEVRLIFNTPPKFDPNVLYSSVSLNNTNNKKAGAPIYDLNATDADGDSVFYTMTSTPASSNFQIGYTNGQITAKNDLIAECRNSITFSVNITDGINPPVGPHTVQVTLDGNNKAPSITNLDQAMQVTEDTAVGSVITTITATDDTNVNTLTYTLSANPTANLGYFKISGNTIVVNKALNYELSSARTTNLTVVASDGSCSSTVHYLYVTVTDVNEPPEIFPKDASYTTYEGLISVTPTWNVVDPDFNDLKTYTIIDGNKLGRFKIDQSTGQITSNVNYDVDNNAMPSNVTLRVKVTDKDGLSDNTTVTLNIVDANDNKPVITSKNHDYSVQICSVKAGKNMDNLTCDDQDSSYQQNNETYFGGSGSGITIVASGGIIMSTVPAAGQTLTATAYCYDRGQYPNPLTSAAYSVSITGRDCTTVFVAPVTRTAAPAIPTTTTTTTTTTTPAPSTANTKDWLDENLPWIIVGALLATLLLGLLIYMILVYCRNYCLRCWQKEWCRRPPRPQRVKSPPRQVRPRELTPPRPKTPPTPVVGPQNGYLYDFWKEKYPDNDYGKQPNRNHVPRPVTPINGSPAENNAGQQATASPKKKVCTIL